MTDTGYEVRLTRYIRARRLEAQIIVYIRKVQDKYGWTPSTGLIAKELGFNRRTIDQIIENLEKRHVLIKSRTWRHVMKIEILVGKYDE